MTPAGHDTRTVRIGELATINPKLASCLAGLTPNAVDFLPMSAVGEDGTYKPIERAFNDVRKGYTPFVNGDILVAKITPCMENGKAAHISRLAHNIGFASTEFHVIRPGSEIDARYLFHMVWSDRFRSQAAQNMTGSAGQKRVPAEFLARYEIPLPSLSHQQRIAAILDKADAVYRKCLRCRAYVHQLLRATYWKRFGSHQNPIYPKKEVREIADIIVPTRDRPRSFSGTIPWITLPDLNGLYIKNAKLNLTSVEAAEVGNRLIPESSVLLSCAGTVGKVAITKQPVYANQQFYGLVPKTPVVTPSYLAFSLMDLGEAYFHRLSGVSTIAFFSKDRALSIQISVPPIFEQQAFDRIVMRAQELLKLQSLRVERAKQLLQGAQALAIKGTLL